MAVSRVTHTCKSKFIETRDTCRVSSHVCHRRPTASHSLPTGTAGPGLAIPSGQCHITHVGCIRAA